MLTTFYLHFSGVIEKDIAHKAFKTINYELLIAKLRVSGFDKK